VPTVWHIVIAASYASLAAFLAAALLWSGAGPDFWTALLSGFTLFLCGAVVHEWITRRDATRRLVRRMSVLRKAYGQNREDLTRARDEVRRIYEALERAGHMESGADGIGLRQVAAEVKVLHSLVEQLYSDQSSDADTRTKILSVELPPADRAAAAVELASVTGEKFRQVNALDDSAILDIVRDGLRQDRVDLYLQPIVSLPQRKRRFYECFSRIRAGDGTMILPEQYIGVAKESGLITAIDNMLLFRCVQLLRKTQRNNYATAFFCNVSPNTIADRSFFQEFITYLESCPDLAPSLVFEFSQDHLRHFTPEASTDLRRLADVGYRCSMDQVTDLQFDLNNLIDKNVQFVKIEGELLQSLKDSDGGLAGVGAIKQTMDAAGIDLIVEKIETEQMLVELLDYSIDFGQGYLFGEPRLSKELPDAFQDDNLEALA
jgi:cyclic-di-GMP phosphodiesterase TipF (flagellum assembly factor)